jgi:hypothetical protein
LPGLLFAVLIFLQFYIIGKVLHLMVGLDERTLVAEQSTQLSATAAASPETSTEISGELNRQSKLIASNLEATQGLQQQFASLQARLSGVPAAAALAAPAAVGAAVVDTTESVAISAETV